MRLFGRDWNNNDSTTHQRHAAQPLLRETYSEPNLRSFSVVDELSKLSSADWNGYRETIVKPNRGHYRDVGRYAASVRKRGKHAPSAEPTD